MIREGFDGLVCDMDGVLYRGGRTIPGAPEAIHSLRGSGIEILFCTNNSRSTVQDYVDRLEAMGIPAGPDDILTSAGVVTEVLKHGSTTGSAYVVGGPGLLEAVTAAGFDIVTDPEIERVDLVTVGWDPRFDYAMMRVAANAVRDGARFVASNSDASFPAEDGFWPGAGAILASIEVASGRRAEVVGKPHASMLDMIEERLAGRRIAAIGDRPDTDLAGASQRGWATILVLSGVTHRSDVDGIQPAPDLVLDSIADLPALL